MLIPLSIYSPAVSVGARVLRRSDLKWLDPATGEWVEARPGLLPLKTVASQPGIHVGQVELEPGSYDVLGYDAADPETVISGNPVQVMGERWAELRVPIQIYGG